MNDIKTHSAKQFYSEGMRIIKKNLDTQPTILNYYGLMNLIKTYDSLGAKAKVEVHKGVWQMSVIQKTLIIRAKGNSIETLIENFQAELKNPNLIDNSLKEYNNKIKSKVKRMEKRISKLEREID